MQLYQTAVSLLSVLRMKHVLIIPGKPSNIPHQHQHQHQPLLLGVYEYSTVRLMDVICQGGTPRLHSGGKKTNKKKKKPTYCSQSL